MHPLSFNGMDVLVVDTQQQRRTECDVRGPWVRPTVPPKRAGRKGSRRAWKRKNAPHYIWLFREPDDVLVLYERQIIATPKQWHALRTSCK